MEKVGKDEISHPQINATLVVMYAWGVFIVMCGSALHKPSCKKQHFSCIFFFNRLSENGKNCFSALGCYQKGRTLLNATVIIHPVFFLNSNCFRIMLHYYKNIQSIDSSGVELINKLKNVRINFYPARVGAANL